MAEMSGVRVLERGIAVLSLLAGAEGTPGGFRDRSADGAFQGHGVSPPGHPGGARPGHQGSQGELPDRPEGALLGGGFNKHSSLIHISKPYIEELNRRTSETVQSLLLRQPGGLLHPPDREPPEGAPVRGDRG